MIPKKINYIFGLDENFSNKPFAYFHYLNILSAYINNKDYEINVYYMHEPDSLYFKKLKEFCNVIKLKEIPTSISGRKFQYIEHICDIIRINILYNEGGIYLDSDVACIRSFDTLLNNKCVMGKEYGAHENETYQKYIGLCNATILSEPNSIFLKKWIEMFNEDYKPDWNYNCVIMPDMISKILPSDIHIEPMSSFFKFSWDRFGFENIFIKNKNINDCYSLHLWESKNYSQLIKYNEDYIRDNEDTLSNIYKKIINFI
jgi:hypothetical protein